MENIKVKVNNEAESKEVQELLFSVGYAWIGEKNGDYWETDSGYIYGKSASKTLYALSFCSKTVYKELTIQQLRDLVVLKRNDVNDATHINFRTNTPFLVQGYKEYFYLNNKWILSDSVNDLKPIEKEMKEYLDLDNDYALITADDEIKGDSNWIEVPKGCDYLVSNLGVNSFLDKDLFNKVGFENLLWSRNELKEFLVNHDGKWTLQLLDSDTEENSYRVAVPSGAECLTECDNHKAFWMNGAVKFIEADKDWDFNYDLTVSDYLDVWGDNAEIVWKRSEDLTKVTIEDLKHRVNDKVNNPSHYSDSTIECIDAMEAMLSHQEFIGYLRGNMFKYQWRYQKKNGIEDLQKSEWYLKKLIEKEMKNEDENV